MKTYQSKYKVLVVEDTRPHRVLISKVLSEHGYTAEFVTHPDHQELEDVQLD